MEDILFINCCPRQRGVSRTLFVADSFLSTLKNKNYDVRITEKYIFNEKQHCYSQDDIEMRDNLISEKRFDNGIFENAKQFAKADKIIIAAPFWDLSFPAVLKAYTESICVNEITFTYTPSGPKGLCRATKLAYISTAGSYPTPNLGAEYVKAIGDFLGIENFITLTVGGLDIEGNNVKQLLTDGCHQAAELASNF